MRKWNASHKDEKRERDRTYRKANSDKTRAAWDAWEKANPEKVAESERKKRAKYDQYRPEKYRANKAAWLQRGVRRRARKYNAEGSHTVTEWESVKQSQDGRCFDCGLKKALTRGHLVPLFVGGSDYISNIVGQCRSCNARQGTKIHASVRKAA